MKKLHMIAVALAAAAATSGAFAQSSVTIYGRLNDSIERQKTGNGDARWNLQDNSSRIGFKGVEDLGGGLKAGFVLESGFNTATGQAKASFWGRQSEANLGGAFGTVRIGNFVPESYFATADYVSMHNHDTGTSSDALYASKFVTTRKVAYRAPAMGGLTAEVAAAEAEVGGGERTFDLAANYEAGSLHLGLGYEKQGAAKQFAVSATYGLGALTLGGYIQRDTNMWTDALGKTIPGSRTNLRLAGMYAMGASELHLNIGKAGDVGSLKDSGASQFTLGYNYNLSKRTKLFAFYTKVNNQKAAKYMTDVADADFSSLAAGVRHNF